MNQKRLVLRRFEDKNTFKPDRAISAAFSGYQHELFSIESKPVSWAQYPQRNGGQAAELISGCYWEGEPQEGHAHRIIVFSHGNRSNISTICDRYDYYKRLGVGYLAYDYPGYGESTGVPSELGLYQSLHSVLEFLFTQKNIQPQQIVLHGLSLGGAVAVETAMQWSEWHKRSGSRQFAGLIVEASFTDSHAMAKKILRGVPLHFLFSRKFYSIDRIKQVTMPLLVIHGDNDPTVPFNFGEALFEAANDPKQFFPVYGGTHCGLLDEGGEELFSCIKRFI
jgi:uncharacterized protein